MEELKLDQIVTITARVVSVTHSNGKIIYGVRLTDGTLLKARQDEKRNKNVAKHEGV